ncbi:MAG: signal recognition particle receptor subunit alpha, partial [Fretibacterium sp.]|nr:signal recognition particle receptor subunit alpha [Fretibacterium sp.]
MFEALKTKLESALSRLRGKGKLSEADVDLALREIRKSLLEADVDFKVVRELVERIRERAVQLDVLESISAAQHISTVVYEELIALMGDPAPLAIAPKPPTVVLMVGLQGSGKTTTTVKLARRLKDSHSPLVVACDLRRPAAVDQLRVLAEQSKVAFFGPEKGEQDVLKVVRGAA